MAKRLGAIDRYRSTSACEIAAPLTRRFALAIAITIVVAVVAGGISVLPDPPPTPATPTVIVTVSGGTPPTRRPDDAAFGSAVLALLGATRQGMRVDQQLQARRLLAWGPTADEFRHIRAELAARLDVAASEIDTLRRAAVPDRRPSNVPAEFLLSFSRQSFERMLFERRFADAWAYADAALRSGDSVEFATEAADLILPAAKAHWEYVEANCRRIHQEEGRSASLAAFEAAIRLGYRDLRLRFDIEKAWDRIRGLN